MTMLVPGIIVYYYTIYTYVGFFVSKITYFILLGIIILIYTPLLNLRNNKIKLLNILYYYTMHIRYSIR